MLEALNIGVDPERHEKYLYVDKDGIQYLSDQYVLKVMHADEQE
jgi:hypothetical protein